MATRPKPVDCDELRACARACADALVDRGYAERNLSPFATACEAAVPGKLADPKRDALVRVVLWLCDKALPVNDGTRAAVRETILSDGAAGVPSDRRGEFVAAFLADGVQKELAEKVRALVRKLDEIQNPICVLAAQHRDIADWRGMSECFPAGMPVRRQYERARSALTALRLAIENGEAVAQCSDDIAPPRTAAEWSVCRGELESWLLQASFKSDEVAALLPAGGGDDPADLASRVRQRRARRRKREHRRQG